MKATVVALAAEVSQLTTQEIPQLDTNSTDAETIANILDGIRLVKVGEIIVYREMLGSL